ncbi:MAG: indole-3-glycerol-phosphate synthase [Rickettsiales bacterium]|jgi:indole-3-glycerol phosphate synthase|nr:indole-3-glycerol-phosphate synthase [Rickettsiales bacterium]
MANVLDTICEKKRAHIAAQKARVSEVMLLERLRTVTPPRGFLKAIENTIFHGKQALIAEVKKASPSKGIIRADFNPPVLAKAYEAGGATCLSVLTDTPYFQGEDAFLALARDAVKLPVLRKDFMLDPYQILEARALGADCILLIMAALEDEQAKELEATAQELGMDVLVEVHDVEELTRALNCLRSSLIGINNRNLKTLEVSLSTTESLCSQIPQGYRVVCESGIETHEDILRMNRADVHCFLVGESLMRKTDVEAATRVLLGKQ